MGTVSAYAFYSRGLPDPTELFDNLEFEQPSIVYDRTGTIELARFGVLRRELMPFDEIPPEMIDATTAIEDKDFWTNPGFDIGAVVSAGLDTLAGRPRGASTITQQLVRARLLPPEAFEGSVYDRKIREIIQSIRLTQAYPGQEGKERIMEAYLNQNFYGNQSYGVKAAAFGYFGKDLSELTLAQYAVLAAIPQSPTKFDLARNAVRECTVDIEEGAECPEDKVILRVPADSEVVIRRNRVLEFMKDPTRSVLSGDKYTAADYDAAIEEELILTPQAAPPWKAPHFVWQIRKQLGAMLCGPENAETCEAVDTGGYRITTSLDWEMQQTVEKWMYAAARVTHVKNPGPIWKSLGIPDADLVWLRNLRSANIHNGAAGVMDYRTGEVLAYTGSARYYAEGNAKFQPKQDVFFDSFRQPGSAIKPLNYLVGLDDRTLTAGTMFMDVVTAFSSTYAPMQSDGVERGPVRLRSALQFSLNVPSIKAGLIQGVDHVYNRQEDFGIEFFPGKPPVTSQSVGTIELHPVDLLGAYGMIANGGVLMPRTMILEVKDKDGAVTYPETDEKPVGKQVVSEQAAYIMADIMNGNTIKSVNPIWGKWQILEKTEDGNVRRPAGYKTGTTDDRKDVLAYGFLAPPEDPEAQGLVVGVWMGNSNADPNLHGLSFESSAPTWSRIMTEISQDLPIARFKRPDGIKEVTIDAFSGLLPGPGTVKTVKELFIEGTEPTRRDNLHVEVQIDGATGLLWQDGCTGPMETRRFLDFSQAEERFPEWQEYTQGWAQRAARGVGVRGGPKNTRTMYFYNLSFAPFGRTWGGPFKPTEVCQAVVECPPAGGPPTPVPSIIIPCITPEPTESHGNPHTDPPGPTPTKGNGKPTQTPIALPTLIPTLQDLLPGGVAPVSFLPFLSPFLLVLLARLFRPNRRR